MEENQPLPRCLHRTMSKLPLPPEATPSRQKRSHLTESITSQTSSSSSDLPESLILIHTGIPVTPTITGLLATEVEPLQLPEETKSEFSETVTKFVQQEVDPQPKVVQQEITYELEIVKPEVDPEPIIVQTKVTSEPEVVQEIHPKPVVLLPEYLDLEVEQSKIVSVPEDDRPVYPQTSTTI